MSISLFFTRSALGLMPKSLDDAEKVYREVDKRPYPKEAPLPAALLRLCEVENWEMEQQKIVTLVPRGQRSTLHILYLHGGGYINPTLSAHWSIVRALLIATGARITVPFYALAPEYDHRPGTALVDAVYDRIATHRPAERIVVAGDSAGGNFALTLALRRREARLTLPDRLVLFSPWLDLTLQDVRSRELEKIDVMLGVDGLRACGKWWAGALDPASPHMSPLYAHLAGLPPIAIFQGDRDIFVIDTRMFVENAKSEAVRCEYHEYSGGFHVFMGATFTPEARDVFRRTADFCAPSDRQHLL